MDVLIVLLAAAVGYLCGSISFVRLIAGLVAPDKDLSRRVISVPGTDDVLVVRTYGATAVSGEVGRGYGCLVSILDMLKVLLPSLAVKLGLPRAPYYLGTAAMGVVGHNWPLYYGFRGGSGMSAIFGGVLLIDWLAIPVTMVGGLLTGLVIFQDFLMIYASCPLLMIAWLWFRTRDWRVMLYIVIVNVAFWAAQIPVLKQYIPLKRSGKIDLALALKQNERFQGVYKIVNRLGLFRKKQS